MARAWPGKNLVFLIRTCWHFAGARRPYMLLAYGLFILTNCVSALQPAVLGKLIDTAQQGGANAVRGVWEMAALYAALSLAAWSFHGPARVLERRTAFAISRSFVSRLYRTVTELPLRWHQDHHSGGTINRVRKAERALFGFAEHQFLIVEIFGNFIASVIMLTLFSWRVAVASAVCSLALFAVQVRFDRRLTALVRERNEAEHYMSGALYDYIGNIVTVLTLRMQGHTGDEIMARYERIRRPFWLEMVLNEWKWLTIDVVLIVLQMAILAAYLAATLRDGNNAGVGAAVAIFQYLLNIMRQFFNANRVFSDVLYESIDVHGVDQLLADHARLVRPHSAGKQTKWSVLRIAGLSFAHGNSADEKRLNSLADINLELRAGEKIALIGDSGSGKTTLLTLLRGLYDAQSVKLTLDGDRHASLMPLADFTTLIPQDSEIFENTVRYNLTMGTHVGETEISKAVAASVFDEVLPGLPRGIETDIRERGVNLSGGQKQRLALARGLIAARDSSLLLMDEPTSSLDPVTESKAFERMFRAYADKAMIVSIHRLHLLPRFDFIVMMEGGRVIEQGTFADLLARQGAFSRLWLAHLAQVEIGQGVR